MVIIDLVYCGVEPFPWVLGLMGNVVNLIVLGYQGIQQTTNIILIGLATADLLYVLSSSDRLVACVMRHVDPQLAAEIEIYSIVHIQKLANIFAVVSRYYTCFIAVERFIAVRYPLKASAILKRNRMIVASVFVWMLIFSFYFYSFLLFEAAEVYNPALNRTTKRVKSSDFMVENLSVLVNYASFVLPVISAYVPVLIVFVCTCVILRSLRLSALQRRQMTSSAPNADIQQQQVTKTLVSICIVFLITNTPDVIIRIARVLFLDDGFVANGRYRNIHAVTIAIMLCCNLINSSVNVIFYVMFNRKFRATCQHLFTLCWKPLHLRSTQGDKIYQ
ncbi:uncharacterized protein LOC143290522 [Babylonia areolata]|uniref:uncharacterized protein LOC143290522 n=1 Tax=Babylonia areolata TaxID=304850 RepID=UPI003FD3B1E8